jgi:predicted MFS family arabinose efflux permease
MATALADTHSQEGSPPLYTAIVIVIVGFLATTLVQPQGVARIPFQNLLKNSLGISRTGNAAFFFWIGLPWYFKPLVGIFTDAFPFFGSRRKLYLLVNTVLAVISWSGLYFTPIKYTNLLVATIVIDFFMVVVSTVLGAYMVEVAQTTSGSGRLTSVRQITYWITMMSAGPLGGYLATLAFGVTIGVSGGFMFLLAPVTIFFLHERRKRIDSHVLLENARQQLINIGTAGTMWATSGLMALFYIAPGLVTAMFYRQQDVMHLSTEAIGDLQFINGACGIVAAVWYGYICKRVNLRNLLLSGLTLATLANLFYIFYSTYARARVIDGLNGFAYALAECTLMDLAIRSTPKGSEGMGFSLMLSVRNFALFGTDILGSWLMDKYHFQFNSLVISNSATTAIAVPLVLLLPLYLVGKKDAEPIRDPAAPRAAVQD